MMSFVVATDGSCAPNPGKGAIACVIQTYRDDVLIGETSHVAHVQGETTSNRAELHAVIAVLCLVDMLMVHIGPNEPYNRTVPIITDSRNVIGWMSGEFDINSKEIGVLVNMAERLISDQNIEVEWEYVQGHSKVSAGMPLAARLNRKCDEMIRAFRKETA